MAAGEQEVPEGAVATENAPGRAAAPVAPRKQQGHSRQHLGAFGKEVDTERMAKLRKDIFEFKQQGAKDEERKRNKQQDMSEAWKKRQAEVAAKAREERKSQLARIEGQNRMRKERSVTLGELDDDMIDDEYRELLEKYGHRVRMPGIPANPWKQQSQQSTMSTDSAASKRREARETRAAAPKGKSPRQASSSDANGVVDNSTGGQGRGGDMGRQQSGASMTRQQSGASSSTARRREEEEEKKRKEREVSEKKKKAQGHQGHSRSSTSQPTTHASGSPALPPLSTPGAARANPPGHHKDAHGALEAGDSDEIPEPERSLMPRKEALRKFQQQLIRKTDVSFYKSQMKRQFSRILKATELTFTDSNARREQASWNLAKPLTIAEIKQLSNVGVRSA